MAELDLEYIINLLCRCDGGCPYCSEKLIKAFIIKYPEHRELAIKIYRETLGCEGDF